MFWLDNHLNATILNRFVSFISSALLFERNEWAFFPRKVEIAGILQVAPYLYLMRSAVIISL